MIWQQLSNQSVRKSSAVWCFEEGRLLGQKDLAACVKSNLDTEDKRAWIGGKDEDSEVI